MQYILPVHTCLNLPVCCSYTNSCFTSVSHSCSDSHCPHSLSLLRETHSIADLPSHRSPAVCVDYGGRITLCIVKRKGAVQLLCKRSIQAILTYQFSKCLSKVLFISPFSVYFQYYFQDIHISANSIAILLPVFTFTLMYVSSAYIRFCSNDHNKRNTSL